MPPPSRPTPTAASKPAEAASKLPTPKKVTNANKAVMPDKSLKKAKKIDHKGDRGDSSKSSSKSKKGGIFASKGVRMLLEAEEKYKKHVEEAKQRRKALLKQAKLEASDELDQLKNEMNAIYHAKLDAVALDEKKMAIDIAEMTEITLKEMAESVEKNKSKALELLERELLDIKPRPHTNFSLRARLENVLQIKDDVKTWNK